jgi:hypothetical protein
MSWLFRIFLVYNLIARVLSSTSIVEYCKSAGSKKVAVCSTFGFDATAKFYDEVIQPQDNAVAVEFSTPIEIFKSGGSDLTVGFIRSIQLKGDTSSLLAQLQALIETTISNRKSPSRLLLVIPEDSAAVKTPESKLIKLLEEAWSLLPKSLVAGKKLADVIEVSVGEAREERSSFGRPQRGLHHYYCFLFFLLCGDGVVCILLSCSNCRLSHGLLCTCALIFDKLVASIFSSPPVLSCSSVLLFSSPPVLYCSSVFSYSLSCSCYLPYSSSLL